MSSANTPPSGSVPIRVITLNIRFAIPNPVQGEEPWSVRRPKLCAQLEFITSCHPSAFICLQEVLKEQLHDIQKSLGDSWAHVGRGRSDGRERGEFSPVFFRKHHWAYERGDTFWLSPTPLVPSRGWDADLPRVVTMGLFRHQATGARVMIASTHFDFKGVVARVESAHLLVKLAKGWTDGSSGPAGVPLFVGGDFNSNPTTDVYRIMTAQDGGMKDISHLVPDDRKYGNREITYTSFGEPGERPKIIDYLFVQDPQGINFKSFAILANRYDDGLCISDHRPVVTDVEVPIKSGQSI